MKKIIKYIFVFSVVFTTLIFSIGCSSDDSASDSSASLQSAASSLMTLNVEYGKEDTTDSWDADSAVYVSLNGSGATTEGSGFEIKNSTISITQKGTYVFSGTLNDGRIVIEADEEDDVRIVLNNANITCSDGPAIYSLTADKLIITLADETSNTLEDSSSYTLEEGEDEPNAVIFAKTDLTINGNGSLTVNGNYKNGIVSKDDLVITGGNITVNAVNDAIKGKDSIAINNGTFTLISNNGDGLQASNNEDTQKGWISIDGGTFNITSSGDGIQAKTLLQITNGTIDINSTDDALHSNSNILISGGDITIQTSDDGMHADSSLNIEGGSILIKSSYEGLEAQEITISDGSMIITANDDGLNAAGGNDGSAVDKNAPNKDNFADNTDCAIRITGGELTINSGGDGIDSNGSLYFEGGTVKVSGPTSNADGPIDYNGTCIVTAGTLTIAGSSGMAESPSDSSTQCSVTVFFTSAQSAGSTVSLKDDDGNIILSFSPEKQYSSIILSSSDIEKGETYTLLVNNETKTDITISDTITKISDNGTAVNGNMSGGQNQKPGTNRTAPQR